jgi:hypothetical protein
VPTEPSPEQVREGRARPAGSLVAAAAGLVLSLPLATWWVVGDLSPQVAGTLSYDLGPYSMAPGLELALGLFAVTVTVLCLAILIRATARQRFAPIWWAVLAPALLAGVILAVAWRAATAGFVGAPIGGGVLALIAGGGLAAVLAAVTLVVGVIIGRHSSAPPPG